MRMPLFHLQTQAGEEQSSSLPEEPSFFVTRHIKYEMKMNQKKAFLRPIIAHELISRSLRGIVCLLLFMTRTGENRKEKKGYKQRS